MIRRISIIILLIFHYLTSLTSQRPCEANYLSLQAEVYYRQEKSLATSIELYKEAFKLNLKDGSMALNALTVATKMQDTTSTLEFLSHCLAIGIKPISIKNLWSHLGNNMDYNFLFSSIDTTLLINNYHAELNIPLIDRIKKLEENDQKYRSKDTFDWKAQKILDSMNWEELKKIVLELGRLPRYKEIGFEGRENVEILFYHMDKEVMEWFLPHIIQDTTNDLGLGHVVLYQLDRIGMSDGLIYTISNNLKIVSFHQRTKMKNGYYCQSFGEWFDEISRLDGKTYETPLDPGISAEEIDKIRRMFCMDSIEEKRKRKPWVNIVSITDFEKLIND